MLTTFVRHPIWDLPINAYVFRNGIIWRAVLAELVRWTYTLLAVLGLPADDPSLVIWVGLLFGTPSFILVVFVVLDFVHRLTSRRYYLRCLECQYAGYTHQLIGRCPRCGGAVSYPKLARLAPDQKPEGGPAEESPEYPFYGGR